MTLNPKCFSRSKVIAVLIVLFISGIGGWGYEREKPGSSFIEDQQLNASRTESIHKMGVPIEVTLHHPTMEIRIGYPAIISPGELYPNLEVRVHDKGRLHISIVSEDNSDVVTELAPVSLNADEHRSFVFPGTPDKGRYSIRVEMFTDEQLAFRDAFFFTVMDVKELPQNHSSIVHPGKNGKLVYTPDYKGNHIPDFSMAGYRNGMNIPDVPIMLELEAQAGDNTERIQAAINAVSALPMDEEGFRGAILLKKGVYELGGTITINASGVVLRGEGQGDFKNLWHDPTLGLSIDELKEKLSSKNSTILLLTGKERRWGIRVEGKGGTSSERSTKAEILDNYVPVGANSFTVTHASEFKVGDHIIVERRSNPSWISYIGMDNIPTRPDGDPIVQWSPFNLRFEYVITSIDGDRISINSSIVNAIEKQWGGGLVYKYKDQGRIERSGVENLRAISYWTINKDGVDDTRHADKFLEINHIKDGWAKNITLEHFYGISAFRAGRNSLGITFQNSSNLVAAPELYAGPSYDPSGRTFFETGVYVGRYGFHFDGQNGLVIDCYALHNRHAYVVGSWVTGPNVFLNSSAEHSLTSSEPHHRWSVGGLYDNVKDKIALMNRLSYGSGHGWSGANYVAWNTEGILMTEQPPTAQNWAIGHDGERKDGPFHSWNLKKFGISPGYWELQGISVEPKSLYLKQLEDRLGKINNAISTQKN